MNATDAGLVRDAIKEYYLEHHGCVTTPEHIAEREFGFRRVGDDTMIRHQTYADEGALRVLLVSETPSDVYSSNARYLFPAMPMKEKEWKEAELIFDIDAKDLALPCRESHSFAVCSECSRVSPAGGACAACSSSQVKVRALPCTKCITAAHKEVEKLLDILADDLGIDTKSARIYFSGNEGYHIHTSATGYETLGSRERGEIADYVTFRGAIPEAYGVARQSGKKKTRELPARDDPGWHGRLASELGQKRMKAAAADYEKYKDLLGAAAPSIGARIDPQVSGNITGIFRLPGSINGKSGLSKVPVESPSTAYADSCLLGDREVEVIAECPHKFALGKKKSLGPYKHERVGVPLYAAVYMICKGMATVPAPTGAQA